MRILSKTWTNILYVLQVDTKIMLVIMVATIKVQEMVTKGRGRVQRIVLSLLNQQTLLLGISEKKSRISAMVMWYLPVADCLRHFFSNPKDDKLMRRWDSNKCKKSDGKLRHLADAHEWKKFDEQYYLEFGKDPRNVWFALSTDGMNLFGERTSTHNIWPVILMMYNLLTWLCQKRKYLLQSILIQGPKHPGIDIDVFLEPLMQEMETL
jgi:hypothetical protein